MPFKVDLALAQESQGRDHAVGMAPQHPLHDGHSREQTSQSSGDTVSPTAAIQREGNTHQERIWNLEKARYRYNCKESSQSS